MADHKAIKKMDELQSKYGGRKPEYITMWLTHQLACVTKVLVALTIVLAILTSVHIYLLVLQLCKSP